MITNQRSCSLPIRAAMLLAAAVVTACGSVPSATSPAGGVATSPAGANGGSATSGTGSAADGSDGAATATTGDGPPSVDAPCTLLTAAEIKRATGYDVRWIYPTEDPGGGLPVGCDWTLGTTADGAEIVIGVRSPGGVDYFDPSRGEAVQGIGDRAYQSEDAVVDSVKGDTFVGLTYMTIKGEFAQITRELARLIMDKL